MTVTDLATRAMLDLGIIQEGESPNASQLSQFLATANDWIDGLAPDTLTIYEVARTTWTITTSASYSVGTGGAVNIARPASVDAIENIGYVNNNFSPAVELMLGPCLTEDEYASLPVKTLTSPFPQLWYYSPTWPLGALKPFPVPSSSGLLGVVYTRTAITELTSATQTVSVPPGYRRYFRTHLAMEIAPAFNAEPSPVLLRGAQESGDAIKTANVRQTELISNAAGLFGRSRPYNIYSD